MISREYFFVCACGCGSKSDLLGSQYQRLQQNHKWVAKSCTLDGSEVVREAFGGYIVRISDF